VSGKGLTSDERQRIAGALERAGATHPCPRCGNETSTVLDGFLLQNTQSQLRNLVISGDNRLVCVATVCSRCGCLTQHVMDVLYGGAAAGSI
jgi:hypothetical protein